MQANNRGNSHSDGTSNSNEHAKQLLGTAVTAGNFQFIQGLFYTVTLLLSWLVIPFFRVNYGWRVLSSYVLFLSYCIMSFIGSLDLLFSKVLPFSSSFISQCYGPHLRLWVFVCIFHYANNGWAEYVKKELRYSWDGGDSMLFPTWLRIAKFPLIETLRNLPFLKKLPGGIWYDQGLFQQYIESAIVIFIGALFRQSGDSYGMFIIFCGMGMAYQKYPEREVTRNARYDLLDAQFVAQEMIQTQKPHMPITESKSQSTGVVEMADIPTYSSNGSTKQQ